MSIVLITHKENYQDNEEFLQSWDYGDFLIKNNRTVERFCIQHNNKTSYIQTIKTTTRFGISYYYLPRVIFNHDSHIEEFLRFTKKQKQTFIRIESGGSYHIPTAYTTKKTFHRQPQYSWLLDIEKPLDEIKMAMHQKTRYNIRLAEKKGVKIDEEKNIELFWPIHVETAKRNNYISHPKNYIASLLQQKNTYQINARFQNELVASAIILIHKKRAYYYFGASSNTHRNVMGEYLMHMYIIQHAQEHGCVLYDWWGMAGPADKGSNNADCYHTYCWNKHHPFAGVARFKAGFGGYITSYPDATEIPLDTVKYFIHKIKEKIFHKTVAGHPIG